MRIQFPIKSSNPTTLENNFCKTFLNFDRFGETWPNVRVNIIRIFFRIFLLSNTLRGYEFICRSHDRVMLFHMQIASLFYNMAHHYEVVRLHEEEGFE